MHLPLLPGMHIMEGILRLDARVHCITLMAFSNVCVSLGNVGREIGS